ncbi:hypothetical protein LQW54_013030 [Pestalotiopsis sp. IQ-011]
MSSNGNLAAVTMGTDENSAPTPMGSGQNTAPAIAGSEENFASARKYDCIIRKWPRGMSDIEYWGKLEDYYAGSKTKPVPGGFMIRGDGCEAYNGTGKPDFTVGVPHEIGNLVAGAESTQEVLKALEGLIGDRDVRRSFEYKSMFGLLNARQYETDDLLLECGAPKGSALGPAFSKAGLQGPKMWLMWDPEYTTLERDEEGTRWVMLRDSDRTELMRIGLVD